MGDFNDILSNEEKRSRTNHPPWRIRGFQEAIQDCNLIDIPLQGYPFTWIRHRGELDMVEEKLDRAMATQRWIDAFPNSKLSNLIADRSDHSPILLNLYDCDNRIVKRSFRFENAWLHENELQDVVTSSWRREGELEVLEKLNQCREDLERWGKQMRLQFKKDINKCRAELEALREAEIFHDEYTATQNRMSLLLSQEDAFWRQRSKMHWLQGGDSNTKFFHAMASTRKKRNMIMKLQSESGDMMEKQEDLCNIAKTYFDTLFSNDTCISNLILSYVPETITEQDNIMLMAPFVKEEFRIALFQIGLDKSPGPDGFNPAFYKRFWDISGDEIFRTGVLWLEQGAFPLQVVETNIVLIPKKDNPVTMKDFRPISLCNVLYKIVSKVLANRLKLLLPKCISQEQSAFVENRSIIDNVMVASEILHHMKCKTRGKVGEVALKIDISKAFDRVNWRYVQNMMRKMGYHEKWVNWMGLCMESVQYHVQVNGEMVGLQTPGRGLRQGDPLSPYLFILCAEGLSVLLKRLESRGEIHGVKVCRGAPILTHLLFADDCFLFCRAEEREATLLAGALKKYEEASGQAINMQKSKIFFSKNTSDEMKEKIQNILQVTESMGSNKYLGLPSMVGRKKKAVFNYIRDRIWHHIQNWSGKHLSKAGREVLIKSVAQSIPTYCMSVFLLPTTLGEEIQRMLNSFWWGSNRNNGRGINWLSWDKLTMRKEHGGMGFRHLYGFNLAMLGKQGWKLSTNHDTIVARIFKARYYPRGNFLEANLGHNPSFIWRSIHTSQVIVKGGIRWRLGDGKNIRVWHDPWLRDETNSYVTTPIILGTEDMCVKDLIEEGGLEWRRSLVIESFNERDAQCILRTPLFGDMKEDVPSWKHSRNGEYSVKSAYFHTMENLVDNISLRVEGNWRKIWDLKIPQKMKVFLWRMARECLPTRYRLQRKGVNCPHTCAYCQNNFENDWHVFFGCVKAQEIWEEAGLWSLIESMFESTESFVSLFFSLLELLSQHNITLFVAALWCIWKRRNQKIWEDIALCPSVSLQLARDTISQWRIAQDLHHAKQTSSSAAISQQTVTVSNIPDTGRRGSTSAPTVHAIWTPPAQGMLKCNVDAALFKEQNCFGAGMCLRDDRGNFIRAQTTWNYGNPLPHEAEAWGLKKAISWLRDLGFANVIIELDCELVVDGISGRLNFRTDCGVMLAVCNASLRLLPSFRICFIRRQANNVAHLLARAALSFASRQEFDYIPSCIETIVMNEMS